MPLCALPARTVVEVTGSDALHFLQSLVTANLETLADDTASACALLSPQGKVIFDFLVLRRATNRFWFDIRADIALDFIRRLTLYKLRAAVEITQQDQIVVGTCWDTDAVPSDSDSVADARFGDAHIMRLYGGHMPSDFDSAYDALRVAYGIVESGSDYALGDVFGHDISLDQNGGVDFRKGCYVGQEIVSRMHHRKTARRRVVIVKGLGLAREATVMVDDKPVGIIGTVVDDNALAIVRLDKVKAAMDIGALLSVNGADATVSLPPNVSYEWPKADTGDA